MTKNSFEKGSARGPLGYENTVPKHSESNALAFLGLLQTADFLTPPGSQNNARNYTSECASICTSNSARDRSSYLSRIIASRASEITMWV